MTRIRGYVDHLGSEGGATSEGDYKITAGVGNISVSGTSLNVDIDGFGNDDGKVVFKNRDDFNIVCSGIVGIESRDDISILCRDKFNIGNSTHIDLLTPNEVNIFSQGNFTSSAKNGYLYFTTINGNALDYRGFQIQDPDSGGDFRVITANGDYVAHIGPLATPFSSGLVDFNLQTGLIDANASGIRTYGSHNVVLDSANDIQALAVNHVNLGADQDVNILAGNNLDVTASFGDIAISGLGVNIYSDSFNNTVNDIIAYSREDIQMTAGEDIRLYANDDIIIGHAGLAQDTPAYIYTNAKTATYITGAGSTNKITIESTNFDIDAAGTFDIDAEGDAGIDTNGDLNIVTNTQGAIIVDSPQILPKTNNSGVYLASREWPMGKVHTSGVYFKPIDHFKTGSNPAMISQEEGDLWHSMATDRRGPGHFVHNTGSGHTNILYGSGIFYSYFTKIGVGSSSGIPANPSDSGVIPWTNDELWDHRFMHDQNDQAENTHIKVSTPGYYEIQYKVNTRNLTTTRTYCRIQCQRNNTETIGGSTTFTYNRNTAVPFGTASWIGIRKLTAFDTISVRVRSEVAGATCQLDDSHASLFIRYLRPRAIGGI